MFIYFILLFSFLYSKNSYNNNDSNQSKANNQSYNQHNQDNKNINPNNQRKNTNQHNGNIHYKENLQLIQRSSKIKSDTEKMAIKKTAIFKMQQQKSQMQQQQLRMQQQRLQELKKHEATIANLKKETDNALLKEQNKSKEKIEEMQADAFDHGFQSASEDIEQQEQEQENSSNKSNNAKIHYHYNTNSNEGSSSPPSFYNYDDKTPYYYTLLNYATAFKLAMHVINEKDKDFYNINSHYHLDYSAKETFLADYIIQSEKGFNTNILKSTILFSSYLISLIIASVKAYKNGIKYFLTLIVPLLVFKIFGMLFNKLFCKNKIQNDIDENSVLRFNKIKALLYKLHNNYSGDKPDAIIIKNKNDTEEVENNKQIINYCNDLKKKYKGSSSSNASSILKSLVTLIFIGLIYQDYIEFKNTMPFITFQL